jgi:undecaprenyl diphosphate synthase
MALTKTTPVLDVLPKHIAIVMDGNGRWAEKRFLPRIAGHKKGVDALKKLVKACIKRQIFTLTVFAFSSENWARPVEEVSGLLDLLGKALLREVPQLQKQGVQLHFLGDQARLSASLQQGLRQAQDLTQANTRLKLNVCFNYGGRWDIVNAVNQLLSQGAVVSEDSISQALSTAYCGDPDLMVRTGGELRISNFLLWQAAYCELYFTETLWPDFDDAALDLALQSYADRERRYGLTSQQLAPKKP